jgi:uncharacterized membrane protein YphA (DoxX/SURF4 family)
MLAFSSNQETATAQRGWVTPDVVLLLVRWILGGLFIYMGLSKALHPEVFLKLVRQYQLVHDSFLLNSVAALLPWFEVFCGSLLVAGVAVRGSALVLLMMLIPFTGIVLRRALEIAATRGQPFCAVKFDCGCGGGEVLICHKLLENGTLMFLSVWLLFARRRPLCAKFSLVKTAAGSA